MPWPLTVAIGPAELAKYERLWALLLQLDYAHHHVGDVERATAESTSGLWERPEASAPPAKHDAPTGDRPGTIAAARARMRAARVERDHDQPRRWRHELGLHLHSMAHFIRVARAHFAGAATGVHGGTWRRLHGALASAMSLARMRAAHNAALDELLCRCLLTAGESAPQRDAAARPPRPSHELPTAHWARAATLSRVGAADAWLLRLLLNALKSAQRFAEVRKGGVGSHISARARGSDEVSRWVGHRRTGHWAEARAEPTTTA